MRTFPVHHSLSRSPAVPWLHSPRNGTLKFFPIFFSIRQHCRESRCSGVPQEYCSHRSTITGLRRCLARYPFAVLHSDLIATFNYFFQSVFGTAAATTSSLGARRRTAASGGCRLFPGATTHTRVPDARKVRGGHARWSRPWRLYSFCIVDERKQGASGRRTHVTKNRISQTRRNKKGQRILR